MPLARPSFRTFPTPVPTGLPDIGSYLQSGRSALEGGRGTVQGKVWQGRKPEGQGSCLGLEAGIVESWLCP